jgi:hypothetical protein
MTNLGWRPVVWGSVRFGRRVGGEGGLLDWDVDENPKGFEALAKSRFIRMWVKRAPELWRTVFLVAGNLNILISHPTQQTPNYISECVKFYLSSKGKGLRNKPINFKNLTRDWRDINKNRVLITMGSTTAKREKDIELNYDFWYLPSITLPSFDG